MLRFLFYFCLNDRFVKLVDSSAYGAKMPRANWDFIGNIVAPVPSNTEQRAIASFLDRETARIDSVIAKKRRLIELLKEKRTSLITQAVTKGLDPSVPMKDSGVEWLGEIPQDWDIVAIRRIFQILNGSTPSSGVEDFWNGEIHWATPDDLGKLEGDTLIETERCITEKGFQSCGSSLAPIGSLVLSTRAPIGHLAIAGSELCTNQGCRSLVFRDADSNKYFYYLLLTGRPELESFGQGSTFKELSNSALAGIFLCRPSVNDQRAIASFLDRETARIDSVISKTEQSIEKLQEYRSALISAAVTGKIDVRK